MGLSQDALAPLTGLSRATIISAEAGRANVTIESLESILRGLNSDFSELVDFQRFIERFFADPKIKLSDLEKLCPKK